MSLFDRPDDVLGPERGVAAEKDSRPRRLKSFGIDERHVPLVKLDAQITLDPRKCIFLADRENHIVRRLELLTDDALGRDASVRVDLIFHFVEQHPGEPAVVDDEGFGYAIDDDLDVLFLGILKLPG